MAATAEPAKVDMLRVRNYNDGAYRRSLPKPSTNRKNITDATLCDTSSSDNLPEWHALTDHPGDTYEPETLEPSGYAVAGSKDGRMVLFTFGCALVGDEFSVEWSTSPMLMLTPWDDSGKSIKDLSKRFDVVRDWSTIDEFQDKYKAPTLEGTWELIVADLDILYRKFFISRHGWMDGLFASDAWRGEWESWLD